LTEQSTAIEQIAKETDRLIMQFGGLNKAMSEQATASKEITAAASDLDQQTKEVSGAMKEQAISFKQITAASANIARQIKTIAAANLDNSKSTVVILERIQEVRDVSRENGESAKSIEGILGERHRAEPLLKRRNDRRARTSTPAETGSTA
jgi:methyl-accepting chemotaxis protein